MDEKSKSDLPYGHFGHVNYAAEDGEWRSARILGHDPAVVTAELSRAAHKPCHREERLQHQPNGRDFSSIRYDAQFRNLSTRFPELQPAFNLIAPLLQISEATDRTVQRHATTRGSVLAVSTLRSDLRHRSIPVAAFPVGDDGSTLRVVLVQNRKLCREGHRSYIMETPTLRGEATSWPTKGGQIQQIIFTPQRPRGPTVLAVRLPTCTHIFLPTHSKHRTESTNSVIAVDFSYSIQMTDIGGSEHADVAFNPWFPRQVGIVDVAGNWKVFEFRTRQLTQISKFWSGSVHNAQDPRSLALNDGWACIAWIANPDVLAICSRRFMRLFNIAGEGAVQIAQVTPAHLGSTLWILDFIVLPEHLDYFCFLTSSHVLVYRASFHVSDSPTLSCQASVRHFRSPEDLSMRLKAWKEDEDLVLLLYSSGFSSATMYRIVIELHDQVLVKDPAELNLSSLHTPPSSATLADIRLTPLELQSKVSIPEQIDDGSRGNVTAARRYHVIACFTDNSVVECVLLSAPKDKKSIIQDIIEPVREKSIKHTDTFWIGEKFIDDDIEYSQNAETRKEPRARPARRMRTPGRSSRSKVDLRKVTRALNTVGHDTCSITDAAEVVQSALAENAASPQLSMRTLNELIDQEINVTDMQQSSVLLKQCFAVRPKQENVENTHGNGEESLHLAIAQIPLSDESHVKEDLIYGDLTSIFDRLAEGWIRPLTAQIPGWVRLAKVEISRRVAADLLIATHAIRDMDTQTDIDQQQIADDIQPSGRLWELPLRAGRDMQVNSSRTSSKPSTSQLAPLPTPSPTATPSVTTISAHSSSLATPWLQRLSKFADFSKPTQSVLPRSLRRVLQHWELGADPYSYNWLAMSRELSRPGIDGDDEMTEKERDRALRKAERHLRRQRKEAAASQAQQLASSQAAEIYTASQPVAERQSTAIASSSQIGSRSQGDMASQIVRGRFGGRPVLKKRRKQGF